jgi:hypothetical protein
MRLRGLPGWTALPALLLASQSASAITLAFDYTYDINGFFVDPTRQTVLETAGGFFEARLGDDLTAITSGGGNSFNAVFTDPGTGLTETINDYSVAADTLVVFAGGRAIPGSTLGIGGPGGFSASGSTDFIDNVVTRGETEPTQGPTATDFAPWGGSISFDTGASWYFDTDPSTVEPFPGSNDFFSVALHELAHLLGFATSDSWDNLVSGTNFTGAASNIVFGGDVPLESDLAHWLDGTESVVDGSSQEAAMDPSLLVGTRKYMTDLDMAALDDVGWEVTATVVPLPPAVLLFASGLLALFGLRISARR